MPIRLFTGLAWLVILGVVWLTLASAVFLYFADLWNDPQIPRWSRPWQWAAYALHGNGDWAEYLWLAVGAGAASVPFIIVGQSYWARLQLQWTLYGTTRFSDAADMQRNGFRLRDK